MKFKLKSHDVSISAPFSMTPCLDTDRRVKKLTHYVSILPNGYCIYSINLN